MQHSRQTREDERMMGVAIDAGRLGVGLTRPNPAVGAVIAKNGRILASGGHRAAGQPHAEIVALRNLASPELARGATIYITMEPCSTHGRTPPCTAAIIDAKIKTVVYGATDPNPKHAGRARAILGNAGIRTRSGVRALECEALNTAWNKWIATGLPFVVAKAGMTLDGKISSHPGTRWITSAAARKDAMRLRVASQAILVGAETVRADNPMLTIRGIRGVHEQPLRVVWSQKGKLPPDCHLLADQHRDRTLVFAGYSLRAVLQDLAGKGVQQVLIEGGGRLLGEAFDRRLVDRVVFYIAPTLLGGPVPAVAGSGVSANDRAIRLGNPHYTLVGGDLRVEADVSPTSS